MATTRLHTIEDLEALPDDGHVYDLIDGELRRRAPVSAEHGIIGGGILGRSWAFVHERDLGKVLLSDTVYVYQRDPDRSLKPDVSFIRAERLPAGEALRRPLEIPPIWSSRLFLPTIEPRRSTRRSDSTSRSASP